MLKKKEIILAAVAVASVLGIGVYGFVFAGGETNAVAGTTVPVAKGDIQIATSADGRAFAGSSVKLGFTGSGTLAAVYVKEGQEVKKGQKLAELDARKLSHQVTQARAGYSAAKAKLGSLKDGASDAETAAKRLAVDNAKVAVADAQAAYDYSLGEYNSGRVSKDQLISRESQLNNTKAQLKTAEAQLNLALEPAGSDDIASAQASVNQAYAAVEIAEAALEESVLRAPMDGTVLAINGQVGENVGGQNSAGQPFMVIGNTARMVIEAQVEEIDIAKVSIGQSVKLTFDALEGEDFYGSVESISARATVDQNEVVTYLVRAAIENKNNAIKDGMTAHVDFIVKEAKDVLLVPVKAVTRIDGKPSVIIQRSDGASETRVIEIGLTDGVSVEVKRGLTATDKVFIKKEVKKK